MKKQISKTYKWQWVDVDGRWCGWNWTTAFSKAEARRAAKKMQSPVREIEYDVTVEGRIEKRTEVYKGMFLDEKSLRRVTDKEFMATWNASYMD